MSFFRAGKYKFDLDKKTYVMGILNVTPDSFSDGGDWNSPSKALERALEIERQGADIIDVGAQSTRPGYIEISAKEEAERLVPVLEILKGKLNIPISIDTFYPEVAVNAIKYGASIINDVKGFQDEQMFRVLSNSDCGGIIMHDGKLDDMKRFFDLKLKLADKYGINHERICLDPGIGFGKSHEENLYVLGNLKKFKISNVAMLVGASRKRVIGIPCGNPDFKDRMPGTIAAHTIAAINGADIIRVHDVKEAVQAAKVTDAIIEHMEWNIWLVK